MTQAIEYRVPRLHVGQARDLLRRVKVETTAFESAISRIYPPLCERFKRHNKVRHEVLASTLREWRNIPSQFRLSELQHELRGFNLNLGEIRLLSSTLHDHQWAENAQEPGVTVELITLTVNRKLCTLQSDTMVTFSLHALARRYERCSDRDLVDILSDVKAVIRHHAALLAYKDFNVNVPGGHWRGIVATAHVDGQAPKKVLAIRTFVNKVSLAA